MMDRFIAEDEVGKLFSASDLIVQPYRSATQSGVTQIAYWFDVPTLVTDVGGLGEIVPDGETGLVVRARRGGDRGSDRPFFQRRAFGTFPHEYPRV